MQKPRWWQGFRFRAYDDSLCLTCTGLRFFVFLESHKWRVTKPPPGRFPFVLYFVFSSSFFFSGFWLCSNFRFFVSVAHSFPCRASQAPVPAAPAPPPTAVTKPPPGARALDGPDLDLLLADINKSTSRDIGAFTSHYRASSHHIRPFAESLSQSRHSTPPLLLYATHLGHSHI